MESISLRYILQAEMSSCAIYISTSQRNDPLLRKAKIDEENVKVPRPLRSSWGSRAKATSSSLSLCHFLELARSKIVTFFNVAGNCPRPRASIYRALILVTHRATKRSCVGEIKRLPTICPQRSHIVVVCADRNRATSAIFVKETRAREHIYITRGEPHVESPASGDAAVPSGWSLAPVDHPCEPTLLPSPSLSASSVVPGSSGVCQRKPSRLLGLRTRDLHRGIRRHVRSGANELHIHLAGSTSKAANLIPRWSLVRM